MIVRTLLTDRSENRAAFIFGREVRASKLNHRHLVNVVDNRSERPDRPAHAFGRNKLGGVEAGVIDDVVDDVEGWGVVAVLGPSSMPYTDTPKSRSCSKAIRSNSGLPKAFHRAELIWFVAVRFELYM